MGSFLEMGTIKNIDSEKVDIQYSNAGFFQYHELCKQKNKKIIEEKILEFSGKKLDINIILDNSEKESLSETELQDGASNTEEDSKEPVEKYAYSLEEEIEKEPIIKVIIDKFKGEVI